MTEKEAAEYLGVSVRTLGAYRQKGTLAYREVAGKPGRPAIAYALTDIERLKLMLEARRSRSRKPKPVKSAPRVTFSLPPDEYAELAEEATKFGMSVGEYARRLAREGLESRFQEEAAELRRQLEKATAEIRKMQKEYPLAFEAMLEFAGLKPDAAKQWVDQNLR